MKHTPGPWTVEPQSLDTLKTDIIKWQDHEQHEGCSGGHIICTVEGSSDRCKANAHLIAEAPTMYEWMREALFVISPYYHGRSTFESGKAILARIDGGST